MRQAPVAATFPTSAARLLPLLLALACGSPGVGGVVADAPIDAPAEQWSWIGFDNAVCGSGQRTGLGVNPTARTTDVVIYLQGGGACWDALTCLTLGSAVHVRDGYGAAAFAQEGTLALPAFDRDDPANPLRDASWVFVPYCTGDLHAGDAVRAYSTGGAPVTIHHAGGANVAAFLRRLAPTFPGARRVFLMGTSAGGYGAQLQYEAVAAAFPDAEVHLLADGAQLATPTGNLWATWKAAWGARLPAGCADCEAEPGALVSWLAGAHPDRRFGLLASMNDGTLSFFFGYGLDTAGFGAATQALLTGRYDPAANARYYAVATTSHTMLGGLTTAVGPNGVALADWVTAWRDGDPAWASNGP